MHFPLSSHVKVVRSRFKPRWELEAPSHFLFLLWKLSLGNGSLDKAGSYHLFCPVFRHLFGTLDKNPDFRGAFR